MSDFESTPVPPRLYGVPAIEPAPLGTNPEELQPIRSPFVAVEAILRQPRRVMCQLRQPGAGRLIAAMLLVAVMCSLGYGAVIGTFSMKSQLWAAPVKVAAGLLLSTVICLPSLYIFTCLSGSRARLSETCGLAAGLLMLTTILLIGFAPVAWLFSQSTNSAAGMGALHLAFWFICLIFGLRFLDCGFSHTQTRSAAGLRTWMCIFVLVTVQMTTALRPLVGTADTFLPKEKKFFLTYWNDCLAPPAAETPPRGQGQ
jgi:hypothetical protein